jgi:hypothetical protein
MTEPKREWTDAERAEIEAAKQRGCEGCKRPVPAGEPVRVRGGFVGNRVGLVVWCEPCIEAEAARRRAHEAELAAQEAARTLKRRLQHFDQSFADSCVGACLAKGANDAAREYLTAWQGVEDASTSAIGPLRFPKWPWARLENAAFRQTVDPRLVEAVESYDPARDGSLVLCGPTGRGKSSLAVAWVWRLHDALRARVAAGERLSMDFAWVSGFELAGARKRSLLGDESPLVKHASDVGLLVLDDVGSETPSEETFVVLDARYREQRPSILTSPLEPAALLKHLGGGAYRRLLEHGRLAEAFGEAPRLKAVRSGR